jgi:hypothetical protein
MDADVAARPIVDGLTRANYPATAASRVDSFWVVRVGQLRGIGPTAADFGVIAKWPARLSEYPTVNRQVVLAVTPVGRLRLDHFETISAPIMDRSARGGYVSRIGTTTGSVNLSKGNGAR